MRQLIAFFRRDARHFQIAFLAGFLAYGIALLQWDAEWSRYALLIGTCLAAQALFIRLKRLPWSTMKSALVTGLGMSLLLKAGSPATLAFGAAVAIASKFLVRIGGRHVFNPGNLGVAAAVLLTGDAWVSPGQWGSGPALVFMVGAAGAMVALRVGRIDASIAFLGAFALLDFAWQSIYLGWEPGVWLHRMSNGSLLLFSFFMVTDPMTAPKARGARIGWGIAIAALAFALGWQWWVSASPIWALLIVSPFTPLLDRRWRAEPFHWAPQPPSRDNLQPSTPVP
ncbi:MAG: RnfABCDGE type electron transport complex subunit D [Flavobacteriales bacterium]